MKKPVMAFLSILSMGCANSSFQEALDQVDKTKLKPDGFECEAEKVDYVIYPKIVSYDITSTAGGNFGFNLLSGVFKAFDLKFQTKTGEIETAISVYSPREYNWNIAPEENPALVIGDKREKATEGEFKAGIDISQFFVGLNYYWSTPFSKLTEKGLRASMSHALSQLNSNPSRWKTRVAAMANNFAIIPVGLNAGLREGDEFVFYNVTGASGGNSCSDYLMAVPTTKTPIAKGRVIRAETNAAALEIEILIAGQNVEIGSQVEVLNLIKAGEKEKRSLLRSVKVVDMSPTHVPVTGSEKSVDLSSYANIQFRALLREYGFYAR